MVKISYESYLEDKANGDNIKPYGIYKTVLDNAIAAYEFMQDSENLENYNFVTDFVMTVKDGKRQEHYETISDECDVDELRIMINEMQRLGVTI